MAQGVTHCARSFVMDFWRVIGDACGCPVISVKRFLPVSRRRGLTLRYIPQYLLRATENSKIDWRLGDAIFWVNFFGLGIKPPFGFVPDWVEIIEDHTHDPWSVWAYESTANWCVASLRKTLPLGNGGVLWSPAGHPLPSASPVTPERHTAALEKFLAAMLLKKRYLWHAFDPEKRFSRSPIVKRRTHCNRACIRYATVG